MSLLSFYWGNSTVNFEGKNPEVESSPTFPSGGYDNATSHRPEMRVRLTSVPLACVWQPGA